MTYKPAWEMSIGEFVCNDISNLKIAIKNKTAKIPQTHDPNCSDTIYSSEGGKHSFKEVLVEQTFHMSFPCSNPKKVEEQIKNSVEKGQIRIEFHVLGKKDNVLFLYVKDIGVLDGKVHIICVSPCQEEQIFAPAYLLP